ncbi:AHH domain-containing protein [Myxococcus sp. SDU36]|uniref:AHH domain-containing protein n=1 Tax=Myxococcus sp. SDU36 TaxID=2831967 RepID=UPI002542E1AA|nr:AHH domain-containing protein [Myxococcus sp. SDU36]WIG93876.1 AHH domain-containing protein [Myxococcus sp. SDU36]
MGKTSQTTARKNTVNKVPLKKKSVRKKAAGGTVSKKAAVAKKPKPPPSPHSWEGSYLADDHEHGCVSRHISAYTMSNLCSHRHQARLKAQQTPAKYTWPADADKQPDTAGAWDITVDGNFETSARTPFYHESHHIVANAELKAAVIDAGEGIEPRGRVPLIVRSGLMREGYNLNNQLNMIILPMVKYAAVALGLPLHRKTPLHFHHATYSSYIRKQLVKLFAWVKKAAADHEVPEYENTRDAVETLSKDVYPRLVAAGEAMKAGDMAGDSLEDIPHHFLGKNRDQSVDMMNGFAP